MPHLYQYRGAVGGRGRQIGRPPFMNRPMRPMRPIGFEPEIPPFVRNMPRGRLLRPGHPRPHLPLPPRMGPGHPPLPPRLPLRPPMPPHPAEMHLHFLGIRPGMPPRPMIPPGPLLRRPMRSGPGPVIRGAGRMVYRGVGPKRLGTSANGRTKRSRKRKITEGEFFCESCDRSWKTQEQLDEHLAEHEVCGRDGCKFTGHPKIILKHIKLQHDSGLYHRIATQNPEDLAKWIAERKSRFPTKENIEKTKAQKQEMFDRGERIPKQQKPFPNRDTSGSRTNRFQRKTNETYSSSRNLGQNKPQAKKKSLSCTENKWRDPEAWKGDLPRFAGTAAFPVVEEIPSSDVLDGINCSDEEDVAETKVIEKAIDKPRLSGVLASLVMDYGSDMSDNDAENSVVPERDSSVDKNQRKILIKEPEIGFPAIESKELKPIVCIQEENDGDSGPEECAVDREDKSNIPMLSSEKESYCKWNKNELNQNKVQESSTAVLQKPKVPPRQPLMQRHQLSLLEKLLKNEIRHERNLILQSVRYVVKNNFFGIGSSMK